MAAQKKHADICQSVYMADAFNRQLYALEISAAEYHASAQLHTELQYGLAFSFLSLWICLSFSFGFRRRNAPKGGFAACFLYVLYGFYHKSFPAARKELRCIHLLLSVSIHLSLLFDKSNDMITV